MFLPSSDVQDDHQEMLFHLTWGRGRVMVWGEPWRPSPHYTGEETDSGGEGTTEGHMARSRQSAGYIPQAIPGPPCSTFSPAFRLHVRIS